MSKEKNIVYMNMEILNVIHLILDYSRYLKSENLVKQEKDFNWYEKTKEYYNKLELPQGMNHNNSDFEKILDYGRSQKAMDLLTEMDNTEETYLNKFKWTDNFIIDENLNKELIKFISKEHLNYEFGDFSDNIFSFYMKLPKEIINNFYYLLQNSDGTTSAEHYIEYLFVEYDLNDDLMYYKFIFENDIVINVDDFFNNSYLNNLVYQKYEKDYKNKINF